MTPPASGERSPLDDRARGASNTAQLLRRLELTITHRLDGLLHGNHLGLVPGHGSELGETRQYIAGDDVRRIDWNVTARMQNPYLRSTIADRELETWVAVDQSPSLDFGTARCTKADLARNATAAIGFLTAHTGNRIGAAFWRPEGDTIIPPRGGRNHLMRILHAFPKSASGSPGAIDLATGLRRLHANTFRRGLVVVISDFLSDSEWERPLRALAVRHEVLAIEIIDPRELELPAVGMITLSDPETGRTRHVDTSSDPIRERYAAAALEQRTRIATSLRRARAEHLTLRTDQDWVRDLVRYVVSRRQRAMGARAVRIAR